jgi:O-antigen/teichoic acid export membrane protein
MGAAVSRLEQLGKDSLVYGLGAVLAKGIAFALLPVFTRIFSPEQYGAIEMLTTIASLLSAVLAMGMDSAQSFYFFERKGGGRTEQATVVSAIVQWRLTWGVVMVVITTLCAPLLNAAFFDGQLSWLHFTAAFAGALFVQMMSQSVEVFRLLYQPWPYVAVTLAHSLGTAALVLLLVLVFDLGVLGYFVGSSIASAAAAVVGWICVRDYLDFSRLHTQWWPRLMRFGAPLVPAGLAMYVMNTSDRWFIQHYHGEAALGIYAVGAKFALLMALAIETFRKAWWPIAMDAMHSDDGPATFRAIARLFMGVGVAAVVYLAFVSPWLVRLFSAPAFHGAWVVVGVLGWQSLFYGFYLVASAGIWKAERTVYSMLIMVGAAALNLLLCWLWVPAHGGVGAAVATAVSFLAWIVAALWIGERLWPVGFPFVLLAGQITLGAAAVAWLVTVGSESWSGALVAHATVAVLLASTVDRGAWGKLKRKKVAHV